MVGFLRPSSCNFVTEFFFFLLIFSLVIIKLEDPFSFRCRSVAEPQIWFVGYGDWTGPGSNSVLGAAVGAKRAIAAIAAEFGLPGRSGTYELSV